MIDTQDLQRLTANPVRNNGRCSRNQPFAGTGNPTGATCLWSLRQNLDPGKYFVMQCARCPRVVGCDVSINIAKIPSGHSDKRRHAHALKTKETHNFMGGPSILLVRVCQGRPSKDSGSHSVIIRRISAGVISDCSVLE